MTARARRSPKALLSLLSAGSLLAHACGAAPPLGADVRAVLAQRPEMRQRVPELVARVERELEAAERARDEADHEAAQDYVTLARLSVEAAGHEAARLRIERARAEVERQVATELEAARRREDQLAELDRQLARLASVRLSRAEGLRALAMAEREEERPPRRATLSLEETEDRRRAAAVLRARARLLRAAAAALGSPEEALQPVDQALTKARDPAVALRKADRAHQLALIALGAGRSARSGPSDQEVAALLETASAVGFEVVALDPGLAIASGRVFAGRGSRLGPRGRARLRRLGALLQAHPYGPVLLATRGGARLAQRRAQAVRDALVAAGVAAERLQAAGRGEAAAAEGDDDDLLAILVAYSVAMGSVRPTANAEP